MTYIHYYNKVIGKNIQIHIGKKRMIAIENLRRSYGNITAVDDLSFEIQKGETFGLLGPNGAGKTTTINMIVGILKPDTGSIKLNGEADPTQKEIRRQIGNTPQALAIYEDLTAEENLLFFGKLYNLRGAKLKERVKYCLDLVGLTNRKDDFAKTFSGGMKRRLNLAAAIIHEPQILLFDEPTVGVDPQSRNFIFENIEQMKSEGKTIIYTTHYMEEAERLCDRIAIVDQGKILEIDSVDNLIDAHGGNSTIVAELTSSQSRENLSKYQIKDNKISIETDSPIDIINELSALDIKFKSIHINRPDLEKVFLNLTGRRLRD